MNHQIDQLEISLQENEIESWRERCNSRIQILKARESTYQDHHLRHKSSELIFDLLQDSVRENGNVDHFIDLLENNIISSVILSGIFDKVSPSGDSLLHDSVFYKRSEIAELISHQFPQLLTKKNVYGNTPLHVAASSSSSMMIIRVLLYEYGSKNNDGTTELTRITNEYGNTALHEAVYSKNVEGADLLFDADKFVAHYLNDSKISPLCLAVQSSNGELVGRWLEAEGLFRGNIVDLLPRSHGISPLHAAISTKNAGFLKLMVEKQSHIKIMKLRDEKGRTPIHFAAKTGYVEGARILLEKSASTAKEFDMKGQLPIHHASKRGHIEVVKLFYELTSMASLVRGLTIKEGQNVLHVAAKNGHKDIVEYVLRHTEELDHHYYDVNQKDKNGNSALHLAAQNLHYSTVLTLSLDKRIDVNAINNEALTARDLVLLKREIQRGVAQDVTNMVLKFSGAKESGKAKSLLKKPPEVAMEDTNNNNKIGTLMIVAIVIVAVTFIAGFTVPGGVCTYNSLYQNPILPHKPIMFKIFAFFNMLAMYSSILGIFFLLRSHIGRNLFLMSPSSALSSSLFMVGLALSSMTLSFMAALSLAVSTATHASWISSVTMFIGICSFYVILILSNESWSVFLVCIVSRHRDLCFKVFLCVISAASAVILLAIVVSGPIVLLLHVLHVVH